MATEDWAVVIGVTAYPELGDLQGAENDANAFYDWLRSPQGGDVPDGTSGQENHISLILTSQFHPPFAGILAARPTAAEVQNAFDQLVIQSQNNNAAHHGLRVGRRLYVYLSGHGFTPDDKETALLTPNATRTILYHVAGRVYASYYLMAGCFDEVILIMDCCRERYPRTPLMLPPYIPITNQSAAIQSRQFFAFASKWSLQAWEQPMPDRQVHGVFSYALMQGLKGAAANPNGEITANSLGSYLYNNMKSFLDPAAAANPLIAQEPDLQWDANSGDTFVIATGLPTTYPVSILPPAGSLNKTVQVLDDRFQPVQSTPVTVNLLQPPGWRIALERGLYLAQIMGNGVQKSFEVPDPNALQSPDGLKGEIHVTF